MKRVLAYLLAVPVLAATVGAAPASNTEPNQSPVSPKTATKAPAGAVQKKSKSKPKTRKPYQIGNASWYGKNFHGRPTASGERYNMYDLTAAHRDLPLGTWVRVTNLKSGDSIIVRINDRGPVP